MKKGFLGIVIVWAILLGIQPSSFALTLGFNNGVDPVLLVTDNQAGFDINPAVGVITYSGAIGPNSTWIVNVTTGISKPIIGSAANPQMDFNSVNVTSAAGGSLIFAVVDSGFTGPITGGLAGPFTFAVGGTTQGTASFRAYGDPNNTEIFTGPLLASLGPYGPGAFSGTTQGGFAAGPGPFSLELWAQITHTGNQTTSFNASLAVPETSVLILLGSGLIGLLGFRRKFQM